MKKFPIALQLFTVRDHFERDVDVYKRQVKPYVIMLSAIGQDDFVRRAINMGARYYMVKPINFDLSLIHI